MQVCVAKSLVLLSNPLCCCQTPCAVVKPLVLLSNHLIVRSGYPGSACEMKPTHIPQKRGGALGGLGIYVEELSHIPQWKGGAAGTDGSWFEARWRVQKKRKSRTNRILSRFVLVTSLTSSVLRWRRRTVVVVMI